MSSSSIETLVALWQAESTRLSLTAAHRALDRSVATARQVCLESQAQVAPRRQTLATQRQDADQLEQRLERYVSTVQKTEALIDTGRAPDFQLALKQLRQCRAIVDDLETEILELFDTIEASEAAVQTAEQQAEAAERAAEHARSERAERAPHISAEIEATLALIEERRSDVALKNLEWYDRLRNGDCIPVAEVHDGACKGCRMRPSTQIMRELRSGRQVHRCRHCARFLWIRGS